MWTDFVVAAAPSLTAALIALATAIIAFWLSDRSARRRQLRDRQDAAMEHIMDAFLTMQRAPSLDRATTDVFVDSLLRFTWMLDGRDEIVTNWVNAKGGETIAGLKTAEDRGEWIGNQKLSVVLRVRDWRLRPVRTRRVMRREVPQIVALIAVPRTARRSHD